MNLKEKMKRVFKGISERTVFLYKKNPAVFTVFAVFFFFAGLAFVYASVELISTPEFCSSCHEMKQAHASWMESVHYNAVSYTHLTLPTKRIV